MKLNKYSIIAFGLSAAMLFAGCAFEGTKTSFKKNENNAYNVVNDHVKLPGRVDLMPVTVAKDAKSKFSFVIISNGYLDEDSIEEGVNFYEITNNSVPEFYPNISDTPYGTKVLKNITVVAKAQGNTDTTINYDSDGDGTPDWTYTIPSGYQGEQVCYTFLTYELDTSNYGTDRLAIIADAKILRENTKKKILNNNGNDECGEGETDSYVAWYTISGAAGTINHDPEVNGFYGYAPTFSYSVYSSYIDWMTDDTARYVLKINAPYYTKNGARVYHESFANDLNSMYTLKYKELGSKKWQSTPVNLVYDTGNNKYMWQSDPIALGTQCYILYEGNNSITWDAAAEAFGGRAPRLGYGEDTESIFGKDTSYYYATEPTYIVSDPTVANSFVKGPYTDYQALPFDSIKSVQSGIVTIAYLNDGIIKISIKDSYKTAGIRFGAIKDFAITTKKTRSSDGIICCGAELDFELLEDKTISDTTGITDVFLQLDNKYYSLSSGTVMVWAGPGVTISGSKTAQTTFGCLGAEVDSLYLAMPGYVCLN